jgi:2-keto-4-pentenoate hydratase/2-oxohepta-3-ene-1,7-dioic acid hydratase in catechol pathway
VLRGAAGLEDRPSLESKIWLTVNGKETQKGDLTELIWNVPRDHLAALATEVALAAGDIIMTGTPASVSALNRRQDRMRRRRRQRTLK